jgi:hypothetical protein
MQEKDEIKKAMMRRGNFAQSLYASGALLCFISTYLSIAVLIVIQLYFVLALFPKSRPGGVLKNHQVDKGEGLLENQPGREG